MDAHNSMRYRCRMYGLLSALIIRGLCLVVPSLAFRGSHLSAPEVCLSSPRVIHQNNAFHLSASSDNGVDNANPVDDLSEERKASLFQFLLRDLQVEGVPLLGCDAEQAHTFQAALWTTMAELSEKDKSEKACLVLEEIPVDSLRMFVDDFAELKKQRQLIDYLPELKRFNCSLVGRGVGPAIIIETSERNDDDKAIYQPIKDSAIEMDEIRYTSAMKMFVDRVMVGLQSCPYTTSNSAAPSDLEKKGIHPGPLGYRLGRSSDVCDVLAGFWNCVCEILAVPEETMSASILSLPPIANEGHGRFAAISELISRSLFLYRGEDVLELLHLHPAYDRDAIHPPDRAAPGHLPPTSWLRAMLRQNGNSDQAEKLSDHELTLQNYQRRSPLHSVVIKRVTHLLATKADSDNSGIVDLELGDGRTEQAGGIPTYTRNLLRLVSQGEVALDQALKSEIGVTRSVQTNSSS